jgi:flagellar basal-body rod modification protein FlgD
VLIEGDSVVLAGGKGIMGIDLATPADRVQVIITDPRTGKDVQAIDLGAQPAGTVPLVWDGLPEGATEAFKDGKYLIRVVAERNGEVLKDAKALSFDTVASVTTHAKDGVRLNLPNGGVVSMADIRQIL